MAHPRKEEVTFKKVIYSSLEENEPNTVNRENKKGPVVVSKEKLKNML